MSYLVCHFGKYKSGNVNNNIKEIDKNNQIEIRNIEISHKDEMKAIESDYKADLKALEGKQEIEYLRLKKSLQIILKRN